MSVTPWDDQSGADERRATGFGAGGDEPYAAALSGAGTLQMRAADASGPRRDAPVVEFDVARWSAPADQVDRSLLNGVDGPLIDLGCGPGRMVVAAQCAGVPALGVDLSAAAVRVARRAGADVVRGSVFDPLPAEGYWDTALLIDGNIGIGGDPVRLLRRAGAIIRVGGSVIVEAHPDPRMDRRFDAVVTDRRGRVSAAFPWAEIGLEALLDSADQAGLIPRAAWTVAHRTFCDLTR
ncbi:methyltransferase domain-containing protein [Curtobacterium ammoniigenes]|uniref:methyltransferase domain-containing protein n=1 Tax=Curtobacterium ammoniigenes TaxID=395387 RepID=UPI000833F967|nr:methyltransferase domain-containing protein [Curtobacterium ammoniigenes]